MSEQLSVAEVAGTILNVGQCILVGTVSLQAARKDAESLILADRKATVERCKEAVEGSCFASEDEVLKALDGVLEDKQTDPDPDGLC